MDSIIEKVTTLHVNVHSKPFTGNTNHGFLSPKENHRKSNHNN